MKHRVYISDTCIERVKEERFATIHAPYGRNEANATIVITNERVYTESEMEVILRDLDDSIARTHQASEIFDEVLARYGIVLDPA